MRLTNAIPCVDFIELYSSSEASNGRVSLPLAQRELGLKRGFFLVGQLVVQIQAAELLDAVHGNGIVEDGSCALGVRKQKADAVPFPRPIGQYSLVKMSGDRHLVCAYRLGGRYVQEQRTTGDVEVVAFGGPLPHLPLQCLPYPPVEGGELWRDVAVVEALAHRPFVPDHVGRWCQMASVITRMFVVAVVRCDGAHCCVGIECFDSLAVRNKFGGVKLVGYPLGLFGGLVV